MKHARINCYRSIAAALLGLLLLSSVAGCGGEASVTVIPVATPTPQGD